MAFFATSGFVLSCLEICPMPRPRPVLICSTCGPGAVPPRASPSQRKLSWQNLGGAVRAMGRWIISPETGAEICRNPVLRFNSFPAQLVGVRKSHRQRQGSAWSIGFRTFDLALWPVANSLDCCANQVVLPKKGQHSEAGATGFDVGSAPLEPRPSDFPPA